MFSCYPDWFQPEQKGHELITADSWVCPLVHVRSTYGADDGPETYGDVTHQKHDRNSIRASRWTFCSLGLSLPVVFSQADFLLCLWMAIKRLKVLIPWTEVIWMWRGEPRFAQQQLVLKWLLLLLDSEGISHFLSEVQSVIQDLTGSTSLCASDRNSTGANTFVTVVTKVCVVFQCIYVFSVQWNSVAWPIFQNICLWESFWPIQKNCMFFILLLMNEKYIISSLWSHWNVWWSFSVHKLFPEIEFPEF